MIADSNYLEFEGKALAAPVEIKNVLSLMPELETLSE